MKHTKRIVAMVIAVACILSLASCMQAITDTIEKIKNKVLDAAFQAVFSEKVPLDITEVDPEATKDACTEAGLTIREYDPSEDEPSDEPANADLNGSVNSTAAFVVSAAPEADGEAETALTYIPDFVILAYPASLDFNDVDYDEDGANNKIESLLNKTKIVILLQFADATTAGLAFEEYQTILNNAIEALKNKQPLDRNIAKLIEGTPIENLDSAILQRILSLAINMQQIDDTVAVYTSRAADLIKAPTAVLL